MTRIAFLGLGAMGSRMATLIIKAGHDVTVWNRTATAAAPLVAAGARQAQTPKDAAEGAAVVFSMVRDDDVSRQIWLDPETGALAGMAEGTIAIECSTLTPEWVRELGTAMAGRRVTLLDAPVSGSRVQADAGQLVFLVGGDETVVERVTPLLDTMGSAVHWVGPLGDGSLVKLCANALLGVQVTTLAEVTGLLRNAGADASRAMQALAGTAIWSPVANYLSAQMLDSDFAPQFPVELIEKDFGYALKAAGSIESAPTLEAARGVFQRAMAGGFGAENMTAVAKLFAR